MMKENEERTVKEGQERRRREEVVNIFSKPQHRFMLIVLSFSKHQHCFMLITVFSKQQHHFILITIFSASPSLHFDAMYHVAMLSSLKEGKELEGGKFYQMLSFCFSHL